MFGDAIDKLFVLIGAKSDMAQDLKKPEKDIEGFERKVEHAGDKMDSHMGASFAKIAKYGALAFTALGVGVGLLGSKMLSGAGDVESFRAILETVTGSAEVAGEKLDWLREFATKTPFELPGLMEAAVKLEAYGFAAEDYMGVLGDTAAALGKDVGDAVEALADATMGEFERLKEFGIKATTEGSQIAFNYVDKNGQQQKTLVDKNNQEMIASTLSAIWNERYGGAMEKMSTTWNGMISNLKDAFTTGLADAGADIMPIMKPFLEELIGFVGGDAFKGALGEVGEAFVAIAEGAMSIFEKLSPTLGTLAGYLGDIVAEFAPLLADVLGRVGEVLSEIVTKIMESGIDKELLEIASLLGDTLIDSLESLMPVLELSLDQFAVALEVINPLLDAMNWSIRNTFGLFGEAIDVLTFWDNYEKELDEFLGYLDKVEAGWDDMRRSEREAQIAYMEGLVTQMEAAGRSQEEIQALKDEIDLLKDSLDSSVEATLSWKDEFFRVMDEASNLTATDITSMLGNFERLGAEMVEGGQNINQTILGQFATAGPEALRILHSTIAGAVDEVREGAGLTEVQASAFSASLSNMLQTLGGDLSKMTDEQYAEIARLSGMSEEEVREMIQTITGYTSTPIPPVVISLDDQFSANAAAAYDRIKQKFGEDIYVHIYEIFHGQKEHEGGLIMHQGGWVTAHAGMLAMNEVPAILQRGEFVTKASSVTPQTLPILQAINTGGAAGVAGVTFTNNTFHLPGIKDSREFEAWAVRKTQEANIVKATH